MRINLTKKQYRDLLLSVVIGVYIREAVDEQEGKDFRGVDDVQKYLLSFAKDFDSEDMVEDFGGDLVVSDKMSEEYHDHYIEEFEQDAFWHNLTTALGQRDYEKYATTEEKKEVEKNDGWLTGIIDKYYEKYEKEFEENGIDRLEIKDK